MITIHYIIEIYQIQIMSFFGLKNRLTHIPESHNEGLNILLY